MYLSCTVSKIWRDIGWKLSILTYPTCIWWPVGDPLMEFRRDLWHKKNRVLGISCGIICMILHFATLVQFSLVTDGQTDRHTTTAYTTLAQCYCCTIKTVWMITKYNTFLLIQWAGYLEVFRWTMFCQ